MSIEEKKCGIFFRIVRRSERVSKEKGVTSERDENVLVRKEYIYTYTYINYT